MATTVDAVLNEAIEDLIAHGFDSAERIKFWEDRLREVASATMMPIADMERMLRETLVRAYTKEVDKGAVLNHHPGVARVTLERIKPHLRLELDRRIMASASLIKLHKRQEIDKMLQRFAGWSTSLPAGGSKTVDKREVKKDLRKSIAGLSFRERRMLTDQGHKLVASISDIVAKDTGAIAGIWRSHWKQAGYDYREDHKERDKEIYFLRSSWAMDQGFIKKSGIQYTDRITQPAEEPYCRCWYDWLYTLRDIPQSYLTNKGLEALKEAAARVAALTGKD